MQAHKLLAIAAALLCVVHVQGAGDAHVKGEVIVTLPLTMSAFTTAKQTSYTVRHPSSASLEAVAALGPLAPHSRRPCASGLGAGADRPSLSAWGGVRVRPGEHSARARHSYYA